MSPDLVPFVPKRWRDAIVAMILLAFAAGGFGARFALGFDPILSLCVAFAAGLICDLAAAQVAASLAREHVGRDELKRRLASEAAPSFWQTALIIGTCAGAAFLMLALWQFPPRDAATISLEVFVAACGGAIFGFYCAVAMDRVERWSASEAQRRPRRRLSLTWFETISFFLFFWSVSLGAGFAGSALFEGRDKAATALLAGYLVGGGIALRILRFTARIRAESEERPAAHSALNAFSMTSMVGLWVSTLVVLSASIRNPSMPADLLAALFLLAFAAPSVLGLAMWVSFRRNAET